MRSKVSKIIYRFKNYHFTENDHLEYLRKQLSNIYEDSENTSKKRKGFSFEETKFIKDSKNVISNVKDNYKSIFSCPSPWIDNTLYNEITSSNDSCIPLSIHADNVKFIKNKKPTERNSTRTKEFNKMVKESDFECIKRYISTSRVLRSSQAYCFGLSGIKAAKQLGIIPSNLNDKILHKRSVTNSVTLTAKNTNSGWPLFKRKNTNVCIKDTRYWLQKFITNPSYYSLFKNPIFENPTSLFHRVQPSVKENVCEVKIRQVWCVPQRIISLEHYFFSKILDNVSEKNKVSDNTIYSSGLTNYEISDKIVRRMRKYLNNKDSSNKLFSLDYSKYDSTIPNFGVDLFFAIIKEFLTLSNNEDKAFECLRCYTRNTPLCYGNNVYIKTKGIMSGSYITNLFDTWFNLLLWNLSESIFNNNNNTFVNDSNDFLNFIDFGNVSMLLFRNCLALCGDDAIIYTDQREIIIHRKLCLSLGMTVSVKNETKGEDEDIFFLGRYWNNNNEPFNSEYYISSHIIFRTKFYNAKDTPDDVINNIDLYRILSICLPLVNGLDFINKYLINYKPIKSWFESNKDFILLKEWPFEPFSKINRLVAFDWRSY